MADIIQIAQGVGFVDLTPTQAGSVLIAVLVANDNSSDVADTSDNQGNLWDTGNITYTASANSQAEINWNEFSNVGGPVYSHPPAAGVTRVTGSPGVYMWVFELAEPTFSTDPVGGVPGGGLPSVTPQDDHILVHSGPIPATANPSLDATGTLCADWFGGTAQGGPDWDFVVAVCAAGGDGGNITGVQSPWTVAGTPQGGNLCAYRFLAAGDIPCPLVFNAEAPTASTISLAGFYSYAPGPRPPPPPTRKRCTLVYDIAAGGWVVDEYQYAAAIHALEEGPVNGTLVGCADGSVRPLVLNGVEEATSVLMLPSWVTGDRRADKHFGDVYIEIDSGQN